MGEIKSTLDLVLEKTRHLTLTSEEKEKQTQKDLENRIKGMLQKLHDGIWSIIQLKNEYVKLQKDYELSDHNILINEIFGRLNLEQDNQNLLDALEELGDVKSAGILSVISDYQNARQTADRKSAADIKDILAQKHYISGTAVVPNLEADERWRDAVQKLRSDFKAKLDEVKTGFISI